jgi:hypothetical protein
VTREGGLDEEARGSRSVSSKKSLKKQSCKEGRKMENREELFQMFHVPVPGEKKKESKRGGPKNQCRESH